MWPAIDTSLCFWPGPACGMLARAHRTTVVPRMIVPARLRKICARVSRPIATVYSIDSPDEQAGASRLEDKLHGRWSLVTALAFLAWFVFAPQCISTIAVTRRETNGWKWPLFMISYLFILAYLAAGLTYWTAVALGL